MTRHTASHPPEGLLLPGLDGSNPLGFLAALGTLQILATSQSGCRVRMTWKRRGLGWCAVIHGLPFKTTMAVAQRIAQQLKCPFTPCPLQESERTDSQRQFDTAKHALKKATEAFKKRRLKGKERVAAEKQQLEPLRQQVKGARKRWLVALSRAVPSQELCLGKHLNAEVAELREVCLQSVQQASIHDRQVVDLLASFGSDACSDDKSNRMQATPFCFVTGSGHQYFLDTVRQLIEVVDADRIHEVFAGFFELDDERLSLRWNPVEDRRYALMYADPTASGNKALTNWALNLLGYQGLQLFPSVPTHKGLETSGWTHLNGVAWIWPIWQGPLSPDAIRSLLSAEALVRGRLDTALLSAIGVVGVYRARRIQVGKPPRHKINFTPASRIA